MNEFNNTTLGNLEAQEATIKFLNTSKKDKALIIGNDEGFFGLKLADYVGHVTVVDSRKNMRDMVNIKIKENNISNLETKFVDFEHFKYKDNSFDIIVARASLRHFANPITILNRINKLLKPTGKFLLYEMSFPTELKKLFESLSFIIHGELAYYWNYNEIIQMLREAEFVPYLIRPAEYISNKSLRRVESEDLKRKIKDMLFNLDDKSKKLLRFKKENNNFIMYYETYDILSTKKDAK